MKKLWCIVLICTFIIISALALLIYTDSRPYAVLHDDLDVNAIAYSDKLCKISINSPQGFVYDVKNNCFIFAKGKNRVVYPGSTSKLITALYALSVLDSEKVVTAGDELDFVNPEIASDFAKLMDIQSKSETTQILIEKLAEDWLEKTQELEKIIIAIDEATKKTSEN